jgi:serine phosphatase RsbU (regulator of sigma subunit)/pSer/pThr/pTyr-binding forkhead associated (FHA) protein
MASLSFVKGVNQGTTLTLEGDKFILGRNADCQVVLNVPAVSREHAVIRKVQDKYYIEDMKSRNGTFVNNQEVTGRILLKDNDRIKICDNLLAFMEGAPKKELPAFMARTLDQAPEVDEDEDESSSTVEATLSGSSKQILETQPAEKLAFLLNMTAELTQTFNLEELLPKIVENMFQVFRQADRGFIILADEDKLIPKVIKTRRGNDDASARFSRTIIKRCLETGEALLIEDASADKRFDLSQSIADCRIRSVMCAPLVGRSSGKALGVIQLDTQDKLKKFNKQDDLKLLMAVAGQAAIALENAKMHETLIARAGRDQDLKTAHKVQLSFLPKKLPQVSAYEFFAHYEPAQEVGGDYYDFIPLQAGRLAIMVGDVAGKGVPAALLMAKVSSDARFCMLTESNPPDAIYKLNELMQEAGMLDRFVTLSTGLLDAANHKVTFVSAGHMPPVIYRKATGKIEDATGRDLAGLPLGVADGIPYDAATITLDAGDVIVLFTDGVTEAKNKQDDEFQMEGMFKALNAGPMTPSAIGQRLIAAVRQHAQGCKQHDDITVVCFGRT